MNEIKTQGNFVSYGPQGERRAAFALESDRRSFEAIENLVKANAALLKALEAIANTPFQEFSISEAQATARAAIKQAEKEVKP